MHRVSSLWNYHVKILNLLLQSISPPDPVYSYLALCVVPIGYAHLEACCHFHRHSDLESFQCPLGSSLYIPFYA